MNLLFVDVEAVSETTWNAIGAAVYTHQGELLYSTEWCRAVPPNFYDEARVKFWNEHAEAAQYILSRATADHDICGDLIKILVDYHVEAIVSDCPGFDLFLINNEISGRLDCVGPRPFVQTVCAHTLVSTVKECINRGVLNATASPADPEGIRHTPLADIKRTANAYFWAKRTLRST
jgi:hypothetical protein